MDLMSNIQVKQEYETENAATVHCNSQEVENFNVLTSILTSDQNINGYVQVKEKYNYDIQINNNNFNKKTLQHELIIKDEFRTDQNDWGTEEPKGKDLGSNIKIKEEYETHNATSNECKNREVKTDYLNIATDQNIHSQVKVEHNDKIQINSDMFDPKTLHYEVTLKDEETNVKDEMNACEFCHVIDEHSKTTVESDVNPEHSKQHKCVYHDYKTAKSSDLNVHFDTKHSKQNFYKYDYYEPPPLHYFKQHVNDKVRDKHTKQNTQKCNYCDYETLQIANLNEHVNAKHTNQIMQKCDYCDYETADTSNMNVHLNAKHTKQNMHKCDYCDFETSYARSLKLHANAKHTKQKMHKCDFCDFASGYPTGLKVHVNAKHTKKNMHNCNYCEYETAHLFNLKVHMSNNHTKQNMQKCDYCEYETANVNLLRRHVNAKHTKQYVYKCDYCDYKTGFATNLRPHVNAKHIKPTILKCKYCDYETTKTGFFKRHVNIKHEKQNKLKL